MAGGWASDDATFSGAARLVFMFVPPINGGIVPAFIVVVVAAESAAIATAGIDAVAIRLIATTCERDCIFCCSGGTAPTAGRVVVEDDDDIGNPPPFVLTDVVALPVVGTVIVVSTMGGRGGFGT